MYFMYIILPSYICILFYEELIVDDGCVVIFSFSEPSPFHSQNCNCFYHFINFNLFYFKVSSEFCSDSWF